MYKNKVKVALLGVALVCSTNIFAASMQDKGFTIGIDTGRAEAHKSCDGLVNCDDADTSVKANIGYQFSNVWSAEFGYTSFGTLFDSNNNNFNASQKANAWTLSGIGTIPLGEAFGLFGRFGIARYETNNSGTVQGVPVRDYSDVKPYIGGGVNFNLANQFKLRVEYQVYGDISRVDGSDDDVQGLYAGVSYKF